MWRVALGPADADRAVGADHVFFVLVASIAILGLAWERDLLFDLVLVGTLVGFISALILARFLGRRRQ
nr:monovalent cation/H+ antiporter complex subunit F [Nesterenkonia sandarakina]